MLNQAILKRKLKVPEKKDTICARQYKAVSNEMRFQLIILITNYGLTCYCAAKLLGIPYTNAKVIYRAYRIEDRIIQEPRKS